MQASSPTSGGAQRLQRLALDLGALLLFLVMPLALLRGALGPHRAPGLPGEPLYAALYAGAQVRRWLVGAAGWGTADLAWDVDRFWPASPSLAGLQAVFGLWLDDGLALGCLVLLGLWLCGYGSWRLARRLLGPGHGVACLVAGFAVQLSPPVVRTAWTGDLAVLALGPLALAFACRGRLVAVLLALLCGGWSAAAASCAVIIGIVARRPSLCVAALPVGLALLAAPNALPGSARHLAGEAPGVQGYVARASAVFPLGDVSARTSGPQAGERPLMVPEAGPEGAFPGVPQPLSAFEPLAGPTLLAPVSQPSPVGGEAFAPLTAPSLVSDAPGAVPGGALEPLAAPPEQSAMAGPDWREPSSTSRTEKLPAKLPVTPQGGLSWLARFHSGPLLVLGCLVGTLFRRLRVWAVLGLGYLAVVTFALGWLPLPGTPPPAPAGWLQAVSSWIPGFAPPMGVTEWILPSVLGGGLGLGALASKHRVLAGLVALAVALSTPLHPLRPALPVTNLPPDPITPLLEQLPAGPVYYLPDPAAPFHQPPHQVGGLLVLAAQHGHAIPTGSGPAPDPALVGLVSRLGDLSVDQSAASVLWAARDAVPGRGLRDAGFAAIVLDTSAVEPQSLALLRQALLPLAAPPLSAGSRWEVFPLLARE